MTGPIGETGVSASCFDGIVNGMTGAVAPFYQTLQLAIAGGARNICMDAGTTETVAADAGGLAVCVYIPSSVTLQISVASFFNNGNYLIHGCMEPSSRATASAGGNAASILDLGNATVNTTTGNLSLHKLSVHGSNLFTRIIAGGAGNQGITITNCLIDMSGSGNTLEVSLGNLMMKNNRFVDCTLQFQEDSTRGVITGNDFDNVSTLDPGIVTDMIFNDNIVRGTFSSAAPEYLRCTFDGNHFVGVASFARPTDCLFTNNRFDSTFTISDITTSEISNNVFKSTVSMSQITSLIFNSNNIASTFTGSSTVDDSTFSGNSVVGAFTINGQTQNSSFTSNSFINGFSVSNARSLTIADNSFDPSSLTAEILLNNSTFDTTITGNTLPGNIVLGSSSDVTISDNVAYNINVTGTSSNNVTITGNELNGAGDDANIVVNTPSGCSIVGNTLFTVPTFSGANILLNGISTQINISSNIVNGATGTPGTTGGVIRFDNCSRSVISDNTVSKDIIGTSLFFGESTIAGNQCRNLLINGGGDFAINSNTVRNNFASTGAIEELTFSGNMVLNNINFWNGIIDGVISGNHAGGNILIDNQLSESVISSNRCNQIGVSGGLGISGVSITGNVSPSGIFVSTSDNTSIVTGNRATPLTGFGAGDVPAGVNR